MCESNTRILVVDDEEFILELWEEMFSILGVSIIQASSGQQGISILQNQEVDFLITDLKMPGSDGTELLDFVRSQLPNDIKIFLCSGFLDNNQHDFSKYNIERIITKPFQIDEEIEYFRNILRLQ